MAAAVAGGNASPQGRSKLSLAVAQASARMNKNKASIFRSLDDPASSLSNIINENAVNHEELVKPAPQDASKDRQQGVHNNKVSHEDVYRVEKSAQMSKIHQQQGTFPKTKAATLQTQPKKHAADRHMRRKDQKSRAIPSSIELSISSDEKPLVLKQNIPHNTGISRNSKRNNMVQRKSHQRLVLEEVAAKYFLNINETFSRYAGVSKYVETRIGDDNVGTDNFADNISSLGGGSSTTTPLGLADNVETRGKQEIDALSKFLDVIELEDDTDAADSPVIDGSDTNTKNDCSSAISSIGVESLSPRENASTLDVPSTASQQIQDIDEVATIETTIDSLLDIASNHLALGKNELALQAYRRAMKLAFDDVISVKNQLGEIKRQQAELRLAELSDHTESSPMALSRKQEAEFESSLLKVASRVADIHNNIGVVHELNRSYKKAQASYCDALDVYHNTCKRFENSGDHDVVRTKDNVKRMKKACVSEEKRKALHEKAARITKQARSSDPVARDKALVAAVVTLKHALKLESEAVGSTHPVAANTLIQMGKHYYEMREYDEAVLVIRQAIENLQNALGPNHPQVCKAMLLLASIYERHGLNISPKGVNKEEAELEIHVDSLDPLKSSLGEVHPEVGLVYTKIGYLYGRKGDLTLSQLAYKAALKAYGEPESTALLKGLHPEVMSLWVRVTENLHSMKNWEEVLVAGERALFFLRLAKKSLFRDAELYTKHYPRNAASVNSIPIVKTSKKSPIQITSVTYYNALYTTLSSLAQAHIALKNYQLARDACGEALQLGWEIALSSQDDDLSKGSSQEPLGPATLQLIWALKRLGKVILLQKYYNDALECFLPCLQLLRSSKSTESTRDTASVLGSLGFLYLKLKRFNEATNFLRECLRLYGRNGVDADDRETKKIRAWLEMAESREEHFEAPTFLEIPFVI